MGPMSRREFAQAAAALAAAAALTRPGRAADAKPAPEKKPESGPPLRVAVVGVKGRGMSHVEGLAGKHGCQVTTICDCDSGVIAPAMSAVEKAQNGRAPDYVRDIRRVIDDKNIDLVAIATPNHWHALGAIWALRAGKHVYVEKPVSHNVWEGSRIVAAADETGKICQTGTQCRSMRGLIDAMAFLRSGGLGKIRLARGLCYKPRNSIGDAGRKGGAQPTPKSCDYDLWCGPAPVSALTRARLHYDWHWVWETGNGDLGNQGIHQMDVARWGLGVNALANSVWSVGGRFGYLDDGETANTQVADFDYGPQRLLFEVRGLKTDDWLADTLDRPTGQKNMQARVGNVFYGETGNLIVNGYETAVVTDLDWKPVRVFQGGGDHFGNFVAAVRKNDRKVLTADIREGHLSSALCHLANISLRLGTERPLASGVDDMSDAADVRETVARMTQHLADNKVAAGTAALIGPRLAIDPKTEQFVGAPAKATEMLRRGYRKGFEVV